MSDQAYFLATNTTPYSIGIKAPNREEALKKLIRSRAKRSLPGWCWDKKELMDGLNGDRPYLWLKQVSNRTAQSATGVYIG